MCPTLVEPLAQHKGLFCRRGVGFVWPSLPPPAAEDYTLLTEAAFLSNLDLGAMAMADADSLRLFVAARASGLRLQNCGDCRRPSPGSSRCGNLGEVGLSAADHPPCRQRWLMFGPALAAYCLCAITLCLPGFLPNRQACITSCWPVELAIFNPSRTEEPKCIKSNKFNTHTHTLDKNGSLYDPAGTES